MPSFCIRAEAVEAGPSHGFEVLKGVQMARGRVLFAPLLPERCRGLACRTARTLGPEAHGCRPRAVVTQMPSGSVPEPHQQRGRPCCRHGREPERQQRALGSGQPPGADLASGRADGGKDSEGCPAHGPGYDGAARGRSPIGANP